MIRNTILVVLVIKLASCPIVFAQDKSTFLSLGASETITRTNDKDFSYVERFSPSINFSIELSQKLQNVLVTVQTNRPFLQTEKKAVVDAKNKIYLNHTRLRTDTMVFGYQKGRYMPILLVSNAKLEKSLYRDNIFLSKRTNNSFLFGGGISLFLSKNLNCSLYYVMPNKEFNLSWASGISINTLF